jgi:signal transduction histidine kinase
MADFFQRNIIVIYFFYGLAFFSMGLAIWLASSRFRRSEFRLAGALLFLAGFGFVHGLQEWFEMFEIIDARGGSSIPGWLLLPEVRLLHLVVSFLLLVFFGITLLHANRRETGDGNRFALAGAMGFLVLWAISSLATLVVYRPDRHDMIIAADVLARYTLAIPGAVIAAWAIWLEQRMFKRRGVARFGRALLGAGVALFIYGVIGQLFPRPSFIFPSTILNTESFLATFGFPIQLLRTLMAIFMALFIIRALNVFEIEDRQRLVEAQDARVAAQQEAMFIQEQARIETEQLNRELEAAVRDLALLFAVSRELASTLDRSTLLNDAMPVLVNMLPQVNAGMILLRRATGEPPEIVSVVECNDAAAPVAERKAQGLELAEFTIATGRPAWMIAHEVMPLDELTPAAPASGSSAPGLSGLMGVSTAAGGHTMALPMIVQGQVIGSLVFCTLYDARPFSLRDVALARTIADQLSIAIDNATLYAQVEQSGKLRGELLHRVVSAQEAERQRIARELHDGTGQTLTALGLSLAAAAERVESDPPKVKQQLLEMKHMNAQVLQEVHDVIADLRPSILDNLGLIPALRGHINQFEQRTAIHTQLITEGKATRLKPDIETTIFRIVQESLTNVARHSGARSVLIQILFGAEDVVVSVQDDGRGFDVDQTFSDQSEGRAAWGLFGILERASLVGGTAEILSRPGEGAIVRVTIPNPFREVTHD